MFGRFLSFAALILVGLVAGVTCKSKSDLVANSPVGGRVTYNTAAIDIDKFLDDQSTRSRVVFMPWGEAVARLGSLRFEAQTKFVFSRGNEDHEQNDTYKVAQDSFGNFYAFLGTPNNQAEFYQIGEDVFVRHNKGHLRQKPRRDAETGVWCDTAFATISQGLMLFGSNFNFSNPSDDTFLGRPARRFSIAIGNLDEPVFEAPVSFGSLAYAGPAKWRELARPLDLKGQLWVDTQTGVILKSRVEGRLEIADRQVRPTQVAVTIHTEVSDIGRVDDIKVKGAVPEFRRPKAVGDLLGFFKSNLETPQVPPKSGQGGRK